MDAREIIKKLGGPSEAARFFDCSPAAVSQMKRENHMPKARLLHVKAAHPDWFREMGPAVAHNAPLIESRAPVLMTRATPVVEQSE